MQQIDEVIKRELEKCGKSDYIWIVAIVNDKDVGRHNCPYKYMRQGRYDILQRALDIVLEEKHIHLCEGDKLGFRFEPKEIE